MKLHKLRLGFATNSSSSHSLIFLPGCRDRSREYDGFGWDCFTLASPEAKLEYLCAQLVIADADEVIIRDLLGGMAEEFLANTPYVDHESVWSLPRAWDGEGLDYQFLKELADFIQTDGLVILGGSDNGGEHSLAGDGAGNFELPFSHRSGLSSVVRKDEQYGFWTLFNRYTGTKLRFSLSSPETAPPMTVTPTKATTPELVDMKITDFCDAGCAFCYQGSTPKGLHAPAERIEAFIDTMAEMQVFEVAIGGGEPTAHPDFLYILQYCRSKNVIPNFTTKSMAWMKDTAYLHKVLTACGEFAYSVSSVEEAKQVAAIFTAKGDDAPGGLKRWGFQYVLGTGSELGGLMEFCVEKDIRLTLLGFKEQGRGVGYETTHGDKNWLDHLQALRDKELYPQIGIDTKIAADFASELEAAKIPAWCLETHEGGFSMYVDLVDQKVGPSSYCPVDQYVVMSSTSADYIKEVFAKF